MKGKNECDVICEFSQNLKRKRIVGDKEFNISEPTDEVDEEIPNLQVNMTIILSKNCFLKKRVTTICVFINEREKDYVRVQVLISVTMKNVVFWFVTPCGSCKNRRFGERISL
jgi:hypothetical protein